MIQRNIANAIRFSSIREHLRLTPMLFWFAMPVWQAFCVIQMSVAKAISCFFGPPRRDLTCTFPLLPSVPISLAFSEKCCILLRKIAWGFCALRTKKTGCRESDILFFWSARRDLNPQPLESESTAISNFATGGYGTSRIVHHSQHFCKPFLPFLF